MSTKITAPVEGYTGTSYFGTTAVRFEDGVGEVDEVGDGLRLYLTSRGYGIDGAATTPDPEPEPADPRDLENEQVGTRLRDAAVDPSDEDFLAPTNAGQANPHGPEVVSPGIHAIEGPGPIVPGPVGRFEQDEDGDRVVVDDIEEQQSRELTAAERVFVDQEDVPVVTEDLGAQVGQPAGGVDATAGKPAGNATREAWHDYAIAQGRTEDELDGLGRDAIRDLFA